VKSHQDGPRPEPPRRAYAIHYHKINASKGSPIAALKPAAINGLLQTADCGFVKSEFFFNNKGLIHTRRNFHDCHYQSTVAIAAIPASDGDATKPFQYWKTALMTPPSVSNNKAITLTSLSYRLVCLGSV